jgi:hypothetical protein
MTIFRFIVLKKSDLILFNTAKGFIETKLCKVDDVAVILPDEILA